MKQHCKFCHVGYNPEGLAKRSKFDKSRLAFHSDQGATDIIALLCLSQAPQGGESKWVSAIAIHNELLRQGRKVCTHCSYSTCCSHRVCRYHAVSNVRFDIPACPTSAPQRDEDSKTLVFIIHKELLWLGRTVSSLYVVEVTPKECLSDSW